MYVVIHVYFFLYAPIYAHMWIYAHIHNYHCHRRLCCARYRFGTVMRHRVEVARQARRCEQQNEDTFRLQRETEVEERGEGHAVWREERGTFLTGSGATRSTGRVGELALCQAWRQIAVALWWYTDEKAPVEVRVCV